VQFHDSSLALDAADRLLDWCMKSKWQTESSTIYDRTTPVPRSLAWFGDAGLNYRYIGITPPANGWPNALGPMLRSIEIIAKTEFNFVLLNRYEHGQHYMGWHKDNESGRTSLVASLSLGATRKFWIDTRPGAQLDAQEAIHGFELNHGSLLVFDGKHRHTLSKTKRKVAPRVNLTFRQIVV